MKRIGKSGELGMLNRRIGESEKRRLSPVPRVTVSPFPRFLSGAIICILLLLLTYQLIILINLFTY